MRRVLIRIIFLGLGVAPAAYLFGALGGNSSDSSDRRTPERVRPGYVPSPDVLALPACLDAPPRQGFTNATQIGGTPIVDIDVMNTTIAEATALFPSGPLPSSVPAWVTCAVADVSLNKEGHGSVLVHFYEGGVSATDLRALQFQVIDQHPPFPPPCEACAPLGDWGEIPGHSGFYEDAEATGGEGTGHRIAWTEWTGVLYFELIGPLTVDELLVIASSVETDPGPGPLNPND